VADKAAIEALSPKPKGRPPVPLPQKDIRALRARNKELEVPGMESRLFDAYPNPFNPQTTIAFDLPKRGSVSLRVFDMAGRLVRNLFTTEPHTPGRHEVVWNGRDDGGRQVASGTYFYRLEAGQYSETKRMVLVK